MFTRRHFLALGAAAPIAALSPLPALARQSYVFNTNSVAINGYDPVAYFTEGAPVAGMMKHAVKWEGVMWVFSSMENEEAFMANPRAFAPQYGGYCAYAMSKGAVAPTEPDAWTIHNDRLYLNFNTDVRDVWRAALEENITLADGNWPAALM